MFAACTIVSPNYLPFARTLAQSYVRHHPGQSFFVLIVADVHDKALFNAEPFICHLLEDLLPLQEIQPLAMQYDLLELNTNIKPTYLKYLLAQCGLEAVVYLDPDIYVYSPLEPVFTLLESANVVLTPHLTAPLPYDGHFPSERDLLYNGTYNLGFIAVRRTAESERMLAWWESRCLMEGFSEGRSGLFVDQKWINLVPGIFAGVAICRDLGCNMAYWNLSERSLSADLMVNDRVPLRFFHFSGVDVDDPKVLSRNTDRFTLADRADLRGTLAEYKAAVVANRVSGRDLIAYGFDAFSDGSPVTRLQRRIFSAHRADFPPSNPFHVAGAFHDFATRRGLLVVPGKAGKAGWREFNPRDPRVRLVHAILLILLRLLGAARYELLMRYLSFITILRNQAIFIRDPAN